MVSVLGRRRRLGNVEAGDEIEAAGEAEGRVHSEPWCVERRLVERQLLGHEVEDVRAGTGEQPLAAHADADAGTAEQEIRARRRLVTARWLRRGRLRARWSRE